MVLVVVAAVVAVVSPAAEVASIDVAAFVVTLRWVV